VLVDIFGEELDACVEFLRDRQLVELFHELGQGLLVVGDDLSPTSLRGIVEGDFIRAWDVSDDGG
jgi:hypothetical protein